MHKASMSHYSAGITEPITMLGNTKNQIPDVFNIKVDNAADEIISENNWPDLFPVIGLLTQQETDGF